MCAAGQAEGRGAVQADVVEGFVLLAVNEIEELSHVEFGDVYAGGLMPYANEAVGLRVIERLEKHPLDHAENYGVGADADGHGDESNGSKKWPAG